MSLLDRLRKKDDQKAPAKIVSDTPAKKDKVAKKTEKKTSSDASVEKTTTTTTGIAPLENLLVRPIITEKATLTGTYVFEVAGSANKSEVMKAVQKMYGVTPKHVRIMNVRGNAVKWNNRKGQQRSWKKAIVRLKSGETINVYEGT